MSEKLIQWKNLVDFCKGILMKLSVTEKDAFMVADNLVSSNLRGIDSHGVARLDRYVDGIKTKYIIPDVKPKIAKESPVLANVDGQNGLGQVIGTFGMELAINKARKSGFGMVSVFNSNHYGYAGYYSMMALKHNLIGISMTNSAPLVVPTFGKNALMGTNPIAVAAPTKKNKPWVMDFATSTVPRGKIEVYNRLNKKMPLGWATDEKGNVTDDAVRVERNLKDLLGGGLLPLGGAGETYGGHKGYGLTVMIDMFCAILSGSNYGPNVVSKKEGKIVPPRVGHMFMVIDPEYFIGINEFRTNMDNYIDELKNSEKAEGEGRIYVHGEKEFEMQERREKEGCPLDDKTVEKLLALSKEFNVPINFIN
ncbi:MAG: malate dehydrogenase [Caldithrix sp. RBG_13_44_9]|nr:MAG: malate dehydrogenase [Caldithrix sp. RBG_13_44_9]